MDWVFTKLENNMYTGILTILSEEANISHCIDKLRENYKLRQNTILIDALLKVGNPKFRYISFNKNEGIKYVKHLDENIQKEANDILKNYPEYIKGSFLSESSKEKLFKNKI